MKHRSDPGASSCASGSKRGDGQAKRAALLANERPFGVFKENPGSQAPGA